MNKTLCTLALACIVCVPSFSGQSIRTGQTSPSLQTGDTIPVHNTPCQASPTLAEVSLSQRWHLSMGFGMMSSNGNEHFDDGEEWIPANLYGININLSADIAQKDRCTHRLGLQSGYFYDSYKSAELYMVPSFSAEDEVYHFKTRVSVIPVLASYDYVYALDKNFLIRAGLRTGFLIRTTEAKGEIENMDVHGNFDTDSTKCMPVVGLGIGAEVQIGEGSFMYIGFDFLQTFGSDCDPLISIEGDGQLNNTRTKNRYYGTISAGVTYTF